MLLRPRAPLTDARRDARDGVARGQRFGRDVLAAGTVFFAATRFGFMPAAAGVDRSEALGGAASCAPFSPGSSGSSRGMMGDDMRARTFASGGGKGGSEARSFCSMSLTSSHCASTGIVWWRAALPSSGGG